MKKRNVKSFGILAVAAVTVLLLLLFILPGTAQGRSNTVDSVKLLSHSRAEVSFSFADYFVSDNEGQTVYLIAAPSYADENDSELFTVISEGSLKAKMSLKGDLDGKGPNIKFAAALKDGDGNLSLITDMRYPSEFSKISRNKRKYPEYTSKKGLSDSTGYSSYTELLSVSHTVVDADLAELILGSYEEGAVQHIYKGVSYWFDGEKLGELDKLVKEYSRRGICVYIRTVLSDKALDTDTSFLYRIKEKNEYAKYYAPNMADGKCCRYLESFYDFIGSRYTDPGEEYGFCASFIIGEGVNSNRIQRYYGEALIDEYAENYAAELRLASNILRSCYYQTRLYVSVNNNFNARSSDLSYAGDEALDYPAKDLLIKLNSILSSEGDIPWGVALDASPSDPAATDFWNDVNSLLTDDTLFITVRNLEVMNEFLKEEQFCSGGYKRDIIIDRFSLSSENDGAGEYLQAAAYAYAYYKVQSIENIRALIYSGVYDTEKDKSGIIAYEPFVEKEICNTLKYIDTNEKYRIYDNAFAYIGQESWDKLIPSSAISKASVKTSVSTAAVTEIEISGKYYKSSLWSFDKGSLEGFDCGPMSEYCELRYDDIISAPIMSCKTLGLGIGEKGSIIRNGFGNGDIGNTGYISFCLKVDGKGLISEEVCLKLRGKDSSGNELIYYGTAEVKNSTWTEINFDIRNFSSLCREAESIELFFSPTNGLDCESGLELSLAEISVYTVTQGKAWMILIWALLIAFITAVATVIIKNFKSAKNRNKQISFDI